MLYPKITLLFQISTFRTDAKKGSWSSCMFYMSLARTANRPNMYASDKGTFSKGLSQKRDDSDFIGCILLGMLKLDPQQRPDNCPWACSSQCLEQHPPWGRGQNLKSNRRLGTHQRWPPLGFPHLQGNNHESVEDD